MNKNKSHLLLLSAVVAVALISTTSTQHAFAHAHTTLDVTSPVHRTISVVLGHTNEPTYGVDPGIHDGKHNMEIILTDAATSLRLSGATLTADMYYFEDIKQFNKATSVNKATEKMTGVTVSSVFGDPGHYLIREIQDDGIYGYHVFGTINYFGEATIPIDATVFCKSSQGDTTKFNSPGWSGSFGCTGDISDIKFPKNGHHSSQFDKKDFDNKIDDLKKKIDDIKDKFKK